MKIILIGNYSLDNQQSMERFALMLSEGFKNSGVATKIWRPVVFFGRKSLNPYQGFGKYLGYFDKWLLFPLILKLRLLKHANNKDVIFHICDHSNAPYLKFLPKDKTIITCHDVLAIRGAFGYKDAYCPASGMGVMLQKWILKNLSQSQNLVSVSHFTLSQLKELCKDKKINSKNWVVIHNAFNAAFQPVPKAACKQILKDTPLNGHLPFILHVGSGLQRKNRKLLLDMLLSLGDRWNGLICYAGGALDTELINYAKALGLEDRVVSVVGPNHTTLVALYSASDAFIFPSLSEGFGWPLIEAQACGTPVIASNLEPMPEVSGGTAIHVPPLDPHLFAEAFLDLQTDSFRTQLIQKGFENIKRFSNDIMIKRYLKIYSNM